jgi:benzoate membrane transport protein
MWPCAGFHLIGPDHDPILGSARIRLVPPTLLLAMAGLALVGALVGALKEITRGPLVLGPMFAFAIALSGMTLFGLRPFFWSLVLGAMISLLLERDGLKQSRAEADRA